MQTEIDGLGTTIPIHILGVNEMGEESANDTNCEGRDIPWLQETVQSLIWEPWEVTYRDVILLDEENTIVGVYNLTQNDLREAANYAALRNMLLQAAGGP